MHFLGRNRFTGLSVGIVGSGIAGALIGLLGKIYGAKITLLNRTRDRLDFLKNKGIFSNDELQLNSEAERSIFDIVIPTTTFLYHEVLELCGKVVKDRGIIILFGGTKKGDVFPGIHNLEIDVIRRNHLDQNVLLPTGKSIRIGGSHGATTRDFRRIISLFAANPDMLPVERLISERISLNELPDKIIYMAKHEHAGIVVVLIER